MRNRALAAGVAVLTLAAMFGAAPPAVAAPGDPHVIPLGPAVDDPGALADQYRTPSKARAAEDPTADARCGAAAANPVPDGEPIVVSIPPAPPFTVGQIPASSWRNPPVADPSWRLTYQALLWMMPLARRAAQDGQQQSLTALINQAALFHQQNPDPNSNLYGWDEGTALRRLQTENCLYALTRSAALVPGMEADAAVLLGWRYYGPPNHSVHNHGLMANLQLVRAADLLGRPAWKAAAVRRMTAEAPQAFSAVGTSWEQSSMYQEVNAILWEAAANELATSTDTADAAASIRAIVANAWAVYAWMTEPDGDIVQIGDSDQKAGRRQDGTTRVLRDDPAGWVVGRWSWTDPAASYYTIRYGPARRGHGHHDRAGGVTWSTRGVRVLVGPGRFNYDPANNYNAYQISPQGQNVAVPDQGQAGSGTGSVAAATVQAPAHAWQIKSTMFGIAHTRSINVNRDLARIIVSDDFPTASLWRQHWHLDPAWTLTSSSADDTQLVFSHPSGQRLTVTTTGRVSAVLLGQTRPPAGWHFPKFGSRVWAPEIIIRSYGRANTTTFVVS